MIRFVISQNQSFNIALYPGDGIGVDVTDETVRTLNALQEQIGGFELLFTHFDWGCDYHDEHGTIAPDDYLEQIRPLMLFSSVRSDFPVGLPITSRLSR